MKKGTWIVACLLLVAFALPVFAQNQLAGLLRDEYALGLTPPLKSAGMGGAYVGVDGPQSMNPAALSNVDYMQVMGMYSFYDSKQGPSVNRGRADFIHPVPYIGGNQRLMIDGLSSNGSEMSKLGAPIDYNGLTLGGQYGRNITDWFAVGFGGYPYEKANVNMHTPGGKVHGDALSQFGSVQLGALFRPHEKVRVGVEYIYIKDDLEVSLPAGSPAPTHFGDYFNIYYIAAGLSVTPWDGTLIALDYWNGEIDGEVNPGTEFKVDVDRWNFGIQQRVCDYCDLRVGSNNGGLTTGFTIHIRENLDLDYAYINQALRDKENVLGDTQYHGVSLTYRF